MKKLIPVLCFCIAMLPAFLKGQTPITLSGEVVEKSSGQPLEFATVTLLTVEDSTVVTGGITDGNGKFRIGASSGNYHVKVDFITFKTYFLPNVDLTKSTNLPTILMEEDAKQLDAVEVVGEKTTVEYKLDKKVFNVGSDLTSRGGSATDILDNVPSVSVNAAGEVSLRGNSNVRILINGKPSVLTQNNGLDQITSESIEKVEVITNPSSRYDAEGTGGIINIVLKKNKQKGLGASVQMTTGVPANHGINLNMNSKTEKLNLFANVGYRFIKFYGEESYYQTSFDAITGNTALDANIDKNNSRETFDLYFGGDYYLNDKNTLTLSYYHNHRHNKKENTYAYDYLSAEGEKESTLLRKEAYEEPQIFNQMELNYEKTFDKKGKKFTANVQYDFWNDDENEVITAQQMYPEQGEVNDIVSRDVESSDDFLFQSDLKLPLGDKASLEAGIKGEVREITSDYKVWFDDILSSEFNNLLEYQERIFGTYLQYSNSKNKLQYQLGARAEYSHTKSDDREGIFNNEKRYTNLFPSVHLTYSMGGGKKLQLGYSSRITRPRFWQLNLLGE